MSTSSRTPVVVVGYDGSEASHVAVTIAARRTGRSGRLFVVHAYELPPDFLGWPNYDRLLSERKDHGRALPDALSSAGNDALLGSVSQELIQTADRPVLVIPAPAVDTGK